MWTKEQQAEHRKLWVEDLRSGKPQCKEALSDEIGHCCLGRACEVAIENGVKIDIDTDRRDDYGHPLGKVFYDNESEILPESVREWLGLKSANGIMTYYQEDNLYIMNLTILNDVKCLSFDMIADVIESGQVLLEE